MTRFGIDVHRWNDRTSLCCAIAISLVLVGGCKSPDRTEHRGSQDQSENYPSAPLVPFSPPAAEHWYPEHPLASVGAMLFFDPRLSASGRTSCGSCHQSQRGFSSDQRVAGRVVPPLLNIAHRVWSRDHFARRAEVRKRIVEHSGRRQTLDAVIQRLRADSAYDEPLDAAGAGPLSEASVLTALTEFIARITSSRSAFDDYLAGHKDQLPAAARRGLQLFYNRGCSGCHDGPFLGDGQVRPTCQAARTDDFRQRTPSLRDITRTSPYFTDGSATSLAAVLRAHGGPCDDSSPPTAAEEQALLAFLASLEGTQTTYYPIRIPGRKEALGDLLDEMERIDMLMKQNLAAIQEAVAGLSKPSLSSSDWTQVADASLRIEHIARRLTHLFPPRHLHDLDLYGQLAKKLSRPAEALSQAARARQFEPAFMALSTLNSTCNRCHDVYRPQPFAPAL